jgi:hypothetical protein
MKQWYDRLKLFVTAIAGLILMVAVAGILHKFSLTAWRYFVYGCAIYILGMYVYLSTSHRWQSYRKNLQTVVAFFAITCLPIFVSWLLFSSGLIALPESLSVYLLGSIVILPMVIFLLDCSLAQTHQ